LKGALVARPKKDGIDYFPVDVDFDDKIEGLIMQHGCTGLAWVIRFWQKAYKDKHGIVDFRGLFGELFANNLRITTEQHAKILSDAIEIGFCYEYDLYKYTSSGIQKRISIVSLDRATALARKKAREERLETQKTEETQTSTEKQEEKTQEEEKKEETAKNKNKTKVKDCPSCSANNPRTILDTNKNQGLTKSELMAQFEIFRKMYPGTKRGLATEYKNMTKHTDHCEIIPTLCDRLQAQIDQKNRLREKRAFVPQWPNLSTWVYQRRWEEEIVDPCPGSGGFSGGFDRSITPTDIQMRLEMALPD
jgi:hypothetical protein